MNDAILNEIKSAIQSIRFGSVEIIIHDSKVVQIERKEKVRFNTNTQLTGRPEVDTHKGEGNV